MGAGSTATGAGAGAKARAEEGFEDAGEKDGDGAVAGATSMLEGGGSVADQVELRGMAGAGAGAADGAGACAGDRNICRKLAMGPLREEAADGGCAGASAGACAASEAATTYSIVQAARLARRPKRAKTMFWMTRGLPRLACQHHLFSTDTDIRASVDLS